MASKFMDFLTNVFYQEERATQEETPKVSEEEMATFEQSVVAASEGEDSEDVVEMARKIIVESQINSDNDEYPDISNVQTVLDTAAGAEEDHELIKRMLINLAHLEPEKLEKDGIGRKQAILDAIEQTKLRASTLKTEKANDEQVLTQAEKDAESTYTETVTQANAESERAIEEEKARSAAIIAEIRQRTEEATEAAKQQREATLHGIADQRAENEAALRKSTALVEETEKQGQAVISQIETWLDYLK